MTQWFRVPMTLALVLVPTVVWGQNIESVGSRALGMGGAFVAVADDSSATWWNPAGLATGPFLDAALGHAVTAVDRRLPAHRDTGRAFTVATPPFGFSYYRLRITSLAASDSAAIAQERADREDEGVGVPASSLAVTQIGATFVQALFPGLHVGATVKYLRGTSVVGQLTPVTDVEALLDGGGDLEGGGAVGRADVDFGVLALAGPMRFGGTVRNVFEPEFGDLGLPRQVRLGAAFDGERAGAWPFTAAVDVDARAYDSLSSGRRRVVAVGGEHWLRERRLGLRLGARFNTVGTEDRAATAGVTVAVRSGLHVDAHVVRGGAADDHGWGVAARASF